MKVKIKTKEKCPICKKPFRLYPTGLFCEHDTHKQQPKSYHLEWFCGGEHFRHYGISTFRDAAIKASCIVKDIEEFKFRPEHYRGKTAKVNSKYAFSIRYESWLALKKRVITESCV